MKEQINTNNESKRDEHIFANDSEIYSDTNWQTNAADLLFDLKFLMKEYYIATFIESGAALKISFNNGQSFLLSIKACAE